MYVGFDIYRKFYPNSEVTEADYMRLSSLADTVIDDWTLERVGRAVKNDEELPYSVVNLYCAIVDAMPAMLNQTTVEGDAVTSFSNGIDSYGFDTSKTLSDKLMSSLGWILDIMPVEWISRVVSYKGGNHEG